MISVASASGFGGGISMSATRVIICARRIVDFIEKHLSDQTLSPKKIAASSRISLSYLYSLFNDNETTVGQFVQVKRLQRAYEILVADPKGHRTVSEVAYEVGFKNVSHFSRSFSRHFKIAPRDIRQVNNAFAPGPISSSRARRLHSPPRHRLPAVLARHIGRPTNGDRFRRPSKNLIHPAGIVAAAAIAFLSGVIIGRYSRRIVRERVGFVLQRPRRCSPGHRVDALRSDINFERKKICHRLRSRIKPSSRNCGG